MVQSNQLYSVREFAQRMGIAEDPLRKAIKLGRLASIKVGRYRFITLADYMIYKAECRKRALARKGVTNES